MVFKERLKAVLRIRAVFLTGGIGITPVRSMVLQATHDHLLHKLLAFYSNRRPEDAPFLDELTATQKTNPNFTLVATMTGIEKSTQPWGGETGYVTKAMLMKFIDDLTLPIYYISGPPEMVDAMQKTLSGAYVKTGNIRAEEFSGY
jgi:ferredoxin-NADP reductase